MTATIIFINVATWHWSDADCDGDERPGWYAQVRKPDGTWHAARRFATEAARATWINTESARRLKKSGAIGSITKVYNPTTTTPATTYTAPPPGR